MALRLTGFSSDEAIQTSDPDTLLRCGVTTEKLLVLSSFAIAGASRAAPKPTALKSRGMADDAHAEACWHPRTGKACLRSTQIAVRLNSQQMRTSEGHP